MKQTLLQAVHLSRPVKVLPRADTLTNIIYHRLRGLYVDINTLLTECKELVVITFRQ